MSWEQSFVFRELPSFFLSFFLSLKCKETAITTCRFAAPHHQVESHHNCSDESASTVPEDKISGAVNPDLTPKHVTAATSRPQGVSSPPADPGDRVRSDMEDIQPRPPTNPIPRARHLPHSVALHHAAGWDFKRRLGSGVRGRALAAGVRAWTGL